MATESNTQGKLVKMLADVYPYCKGDVVRLEKDVLAAIDRVAKSRKISQAYEDFQTGEADVEQDVSKAEASVKAKVAQVKAKTAQPVEPVESEVAKTPTPTTAKPAS